MSRSGFLFGAIRAQARIGFDLCRSLLLPVVEPPGSAGTQLLSRPAEGRPADPEQPGRIRVVSWNIHRCYRREGIRQGLAEILADEDPDLLLLQEVPVFPHVPFWELDGIRQLLSAFHLQYCTMHRVSAPTAYYPFVHTGLVSLSKEPPGSVQAIPLPTVSRPKLGSGHAVQRVALYTSYDSAYGSLAVVNLHLENTTSPRGRAVQIRHLLGELRRFAAPQTIIAGDVNTLLGTWEPVPEVLEQEGYRQVHLGGAPRFRPLLDRIFLRGMTGSGRVLAIPGSDHRPILVDAEASRIPKTTP